MAKKKIEGFGWYLAALVVSLFLIFFVGRHFNPDTQTTSMVLTSDGVNHFKKGMDVAGGVRLTYKIDLSEYEQVYTNPIEYNQVTTNVKDIILKNIDKRISGLGVSDYTSYIQSLSDGEYVVIEIGGVSDLDQAKEIIGKTVEIEFKTLYEGDKTQPDPGRKIIAEDLLKQITATPDLMRDLGRNKEGDNIYYRAYNDAPYSELPQVYQDNVSKLQGLQPGTVVASLIAGTYGEAVGLVDGELESTTLNGWSIVKFNGTTQGVADGSGAAETLYSFEDVLVEYTPVWETAIDPQSNKILNGAYFKQATVSSNQTNGMPVVVINFDETGKEIFCNLTTEIIGENLAIFVGGQLMTAPVIRDRICGGSAQIDGNFDPESARELVDNLNEGALPAPLILAHEEKVSATLGQQAFEGALIAAAIGFVLIFLFMLYQYGIRQAAVAILSLLWFMAVLLAIVKLVGYALSLSGIAAILLSIGMGVDANVLIYERVREERKNKGSGRAAIEE